MKPPGAMVMRLVHIRGPLQGKIDEFPGPMVCIGRDSSCDVVLPETAVDIAPRHVQLVRDGNRFKVTACEGSATLVNGKPAAETYLRDGDVLTLGNGGVKISFLAEFRDDLPSPPAAGPGGRGESGEETEGQRADDKTVPLASPAERPHAGTPSPGESRPGPPPGEIVKAPLVIQYGPMIRAFDRLPVTVGKSKSCDCRIDHPALLDQHGQFLFQGDRYWIRDLTGQSSVRINQRPVAVVAPLEPNDRLDLSPAGPAFLFLGKGRLREYVEVPENELAETTAAAPRPIPQIDEPKALWEVLRRKLAGFPVRKVPAGDKLIEEGTSGTSAYVLDDGQVLIEICGHEIASISAPGAIFGEMAALLGRPRSATVTAMRDSAFLVIDDLQGLLRKDHEFSLILLRLLAQRIDATNTLAIDKKKWWQVF